MIFHLITILKEEFVWKCATYVALQVWLIIRRLYVFSSPLARKYILQTERDWPLSLCPFVAWQCGPYPPRRRLMAAYPQVLVAPSPKPFLPCALSTMRNYLYALATHPCPVSLMFFAAGTPRRFSPKNSARNRDVFRDFSFRWHAKYTFN